MSLKEPEADACLSCWHRAVDHESRLLSETDAEDVCLAGGCVCNEFSSAHAAVDLLRGYLIDVYDLLHQRLAEVTNRIQDTAAGKCICRGDFPRTEQDQQGSVFYEVTSHAPYCPCESSYDALP